MALNIIPSQMIYSQISHSTIFTNNYLLYKKFTQSVKKIDIKIYY